MQRTTFSPKCCCRQFSWCSSALRSSARAGRLAYRDLEDQLLATVLRGQGIENRGELLALELDWVPESAMMELMSVLSRPRVDGGQKSFSHTVDDGTDDLVDLAALGDISAGEASRQRRSEVLLDGLEGGAKRRPAEGGGPQRPVDAAAIPSCQRPYGANGIGNRRRAYLLSILQDVGGQGRWGSGEVDGERGSSSGRRSRCNFTASEILRGGHRPRPHAGWSSDHAFRMPDPNNIRPKQP